MEEDTHVPSEATRKLRKDLGSKTGTRCGTSPSYNTSEPRSVFTDRGSELRGPEGI